MALLDEAGFIRLIDRKKKMIISGGENIYPSEVESLLGGHQAVQDVVVIGVPDDKWCERVHAVIVLQQGAAVDEAEIIDWARDRIAGFKRPRSVAFVAHDDIPRTATGKILHRVRKRTWGRFRTFRMPTSCRRAALCAHSAGRGAADPGDGPSLVARDV